MDKIVRKHGFQKPFSYYQIISWIFFISNLIVYSLFTIPLLLHAELVLSLVLYSCCLAFVIIFWYLASITDPHDNSQFSSGLFCRFCFKYVREDSRHCRECNKCIFKFDHHCALLNNCIGEFNYRYFIILLSAVNLSYLIIVIFSILVTVKLFYGNEVENKLIGVREEVSKGMNFLNLLGCSCSLVLGTCLLFFHGFLKWKKMSTYDYFISKKIKDEKKNIDGDLKNSTSREIEVTGIANE